jgi:mRNA-degrading endonuclease RelE of RelBE toxin-antitoxin system
MNYSVKTLPRFEKSLKKLAKKYPSLKTEYINLIKLLKEKPEQGKSLGKNCYKIRLAIKSKGKGKSGGARVITNFVIDDNTVFLLSIYDKADKETLTDAELKELLKLLPS